MKRDCWAGSTSGTLGRGQPGDTAQRRQEVAEPLAEHRPGVLVFSSTSTGPRTLSST
ncbi:hypothetical protein [Actinomadura sp. NBRC 104425]|uniref:hypothetical protein n=1 Tax=Actinomadura sp. NBRC 104425 TaxID=3032204 RepID=UPI00255295D2|nr:hypothetical protein [Actinomadura sp. NBRC 104425]